MTNRYIALVIGGSSKQYEYQLKDEIYKWGIIPFRHWTLDRHQHRLPSKHVPHQCNLIIAFIGQLSHSLYSNIKKMAKKYNIVQVALPFNTTDWPLPLRLSGISTNYNPSLNFASYKEEPKPVKPEPVYFIEEKPMPTNIEPSVIIKPFIKRRGNRLVSPTRDLVKYLTTGNGKSAFILATQEAMLSTGKDAIPQVQFWRNVDKALINNKVIESPIASAFIGPLHFATKPETIQALTEAGIYPVKVHPRLVQYRLTPPDKSTQAQATSAASNTLIVEPVVKQLKASSQQQLSSQSSTAKRIDNLVATINRLGDELSQISVELLELRHQLRKSNN